MRNLYLLPLVHGPKHESGLSAEGPQGCAANPPLQEMALPTACMSTLVSIQAACRAPIYSSTARAWARAMWAGERL